MEREGLEARPKLTIAAEVAQIASFVGPVLIGALALATPAIGGWLVTDPWWAGFMWAAGSFGCSALALSFGVFAPLCLLSFYLEAWRLRRANAYIEQAIVQGTRVAVDDAATARDAYARMHATNVQILGLVERDLGHAFNGEALVPLPKKADNG